MMLGDTITFWAMSLESLRWMPTSRIFVSCGCSYDGSIGPVNGGLVKDHLPTWTKVREECDKKSHDFDFEQ